MMISAEEGYIKFNCNLQESEFGFPDIIYELLEKWRGEMYHMGLIGMYDNGIGFGNISHRVGNTNQFIISGSATGKYPQLDKKHYALVTDFNFEENSLDCCGYVKASSESLSHAAVYKHLDVVNAVIHIHSKALWEKFRFRLPTTGESIPYGTPEMAREIRRVISENGINNKGVIVMAGHEEGIIAFGEDMDAAGKMIRTLWNKLNAEK